jgi:hypothetical protein
MKLTRENRSTREKTCPSATLSTTNPTWTDSGSNPATNRLSHGTAMGQLLNKYSNATVGYANTQILQNYLTREDKAERTHKI